jgi:hypothetical protein
MPSTPIPQKRMGTLSELMNGYDGQKTKTETYH